MSIRKRPQAKDVFIQFREAFLAGDLNQMVDLYIEESTFFDVDGEASGLSAIREKFRLFFEAVEVTDYEVIERTEADIAPGFAVATMRFRSVARVRGDESAPPLNAYGRSTEVLTQVDGEWYFLVDHASFPVQP